MKTKQFTQEKKYEYLCINVLRPCNSKSKFELVLASDPYKHHEFGRLKSFLVASVRLYMIRLILHNNLNKHVVRLCCDGVVLNKEFDFSKNKEFDYYPVPENKCTGELTWYHANDNNRMRERRTG